MVANPVGQLTRENIFSLSTFAPLNLVSNETGLAYRGIIFQNIKRVQGPHFFCRHSPINSFHQDRWAFRCRGGYLFDLVPSGQRTDNVSNPVCA